MMENLTPKSEDQLKQTPILNTLQTNKICLLNIREKSGNDI